MLYIKRVTGIKITKRAIHCQSANLEWITLPIDTPERIFSLLYLTFRILSRVFQKFSIRNGTLKTKYGKEYTMKELVQIKKGLDFLCDMNYI